MSSRLPQLVLTLVILTASQWHAVEAGGVPPQQSGGQPTDQRFSALVGRWERRDAILSVDDSGFASASWRVGICGVAPDPCDWVEPGLLVYGGRAEMIFSDVQQGDPFTAIGRTIWTTQAATIPRGRVVLTKLAADLVMLEAENNRPIYLCRAPRNLNDCDR